MTSGAHRLYGKGKWRAMFGDGPTAGTPWPHGGMNPKLSEKIKPEVAKVVSDPGKHVAQVDPRELHSNQGSLTRDGVAYYLHSPEYNRTGRTYADQDQAGNQHPVVLRRTNGRHVILSGHHRAAAALLKGQPLTAAVVHEPPDEEGSKP